MVRKFIMPFAAITLMLSCDTNNRLNVQQIKQSFRGVIIYKVEVRKGVISGARVKLDKAKDTLISLGMHSMKKLNIGDSIYKPPVSPFYYYKSNLKWNKRVYVVITEDLQKDKVFPEQWRIKCQHDWADACK